MPKTPDDVGRFFRPKDGECAEKRLCIAIMASKSASIAAILKLSSEFLAKIILMAIAVNSSFTATIPYVYGGNAPVISLGQSPGVISTAVALAEAGSVVLSLPGAPKGAVTYTASGLLHALASAGTATSKPTTSTEETTSVDDGILASINNPGSTDGVYDGSGVFTSTSGISANFADVLSSNPGLSAVAVSDSFTQGIVGTLVNTSA